MGFHSRSMYPVTILIYSEGRRRYGILVMIYLGGTACWHGCSAPSLSGRDAAKVEVEEASEVKLVARTIEGCVAHLGSA